jgi:hypothetical protein
LAHERQVFSVGGQQLFQFACLRSVALDQRHECSFRPGIGRYQKRESIFRVASAKRCQPTRRHLRIDFWAKIAGVDPSQRWIERDGRGGQLFSALAIRMGDGRESKGGSVFFFFCAVSEVFNIALLQINGRELQPNAAYGGHGFAAPREKEKNGRSHEEDCGGQA